MSPSLGLGGAGSSAPLRFCYDVIAADSNQHRNQCRTIRLLGSVHASNYWFTLLASVFLIITCCLRGTAHAKVLPEIYWNSTNPIFRIDNTEHVFVVKINDRVDFICPYYQQQITSSMDHQQIDSTMEVMEIYSVSQWSYDYCALDTDSVLAGVCNNPFQRTYATIVFREYTPKPGGLEFKPGRSYYFISTSSGQMNDLQNKHGGLCSSKNMKVKFEVKSHHGSAPSRSVDGDAQEAAGGDYNAQTQLPPPQPSGGTGNNNEDEDGAGGGGRNEFVSSNAGEAETSAGGSSAVVSGQIGAAIGDNDRGRNEDGDFVTPTPRLYEVHTRPEGELLVPVNIRPENGEQYGANAHQRRNANPSNKYSSGQTTTILFCLSVIYLLYVERFFVLGGR